MGRHWGRSLGCQSTERLSDKSFYAAVLNFSLGMCKLKLAKDKDVLFVSYWSLWVENLVTFFLKQLPLAALHVAGLNG